MRTASAIRSASLGIWPLALVLALASQILAAPKLLVQPERVALADAFARRQLLLSVDGRDATRGAVFESDNLAVARVDERGYVTPVAAGSASIKIRSENQTTSVPVTIEAFDDQRPIDFATQIVPLLSRFGCNAGGCHGKASGQNGFKLSLFGFDPQFDYEAIALAGRGRRVFPADPESSLLLRKASGRSPHGGGRRIAVDSEPYQMILRWIDQGLPPASSDVPQLVRLVVEPAERILTAGAYQQLAVEAEYSDGTRRDITREAQYGSNLEVVATADDLGLVHCGAETGEAAIMVRYMGRVAVFRVVVPHGPPLAKIPNFEPQGYIDTLVAKKWQKLGLTPSPLADDATFLRRATVDVCGRLPTVDEARQYLADSGADKRTRLVDRLLDSPDYPAYFAMLWGSILRNSHLAGSDKAAYAMHDWLKEVIGTNMPYDQFTREFLASSGEWQNSPAVNWYWQIRDDEAHQATADTAQLFLGTRLQCARCHHHPYERWGQNDYYGLMGFFMRVGKLPVDEPRGIFPAAQNTSGVNNPLTGKVAEPKYLDGDEARFGPEEDPRQSLVDWMARPDNPLFAKTLVNRLWGHFFGRGIVDPVDDMRETNPPSNPELLDALAKDFVEHKFDMRHMVRTMLLSRAYQLDSAPTDANRHDRQNFARYYARRLMAEVVVDAVDQVCGTYSGYGGNMFKTARAVDLPHTGFGSYFLDTFDRPKRVSACECERSSGATLGQVLQLANSDEVEGKIGSGTGRLETLIKQKKPARDIIEECYLAALARPPRADELEKALAFVARYQTKGEPESRSALQDVLWTLINSKEFLFNR